MADRRLLLTRSELQNVNYYWLSAFRLRVDVSDPSDSGADPNVFLYLQRPVNPYDGSVDSDFHAVAGPVDMAEYPVGEPRDGTAYPFFRLPYIELDFRSTEVVEKIWALLILEVGQLLNALNRMDQLVQTEQLWVGAPLPSDPPPGSGSSGSSMSGP